MFNTNKRNAYFMNCSEVVRDFLKYISSEDIVFDLVKLDNKFNEDVASLYVTVLNNDYRVCSEVLRYAICRSLNLESDMNYNYQWKDLAIICSEHLSSSLFFASRVSKDKKRGILQCCMHIFYSLKNIAINCEV